MTDPNGVWTPIMTLYKRFHGEVGGTRDAYGLILDRESLSGSPSSSMIGRRVLCECLAGRVGEDGRCPPIRAPLGGQGVPWLLVWCESALAPTSSV